MTLEQEIYEYLQYFDKDNILMTDKDNVRIAICHYTDAGLALGLADFSKKKPAYYEALFFGGKAYRLKKHEGSKDRDKMAFFKNYSGLIRESIKESKKLTECRKIIKVLENVDYRANN